MGAPGQGSEADQACVKTTSALCILPRGVPLPEEIAAHIAWCKHCRQLASMSQAGWEPDQPPAGRWNRIQSAILRDLKPVRPLAARGVYAVTLGFIFVAVVAAALMPPVSAGGWHALTTKQRVAVFSLIGLGGALLTISLVRQMAPGSKEPISPIALLVGVPVALALATALLFRPRQEPEFIANGAVCFRLGISYSIPAAVILCAALRRGAFIRPLLSGMILGGFAGLAGMAVLELKCANPDFYHILMWHGGVVMAGVLGGGAAGSVFW